MEGFVSRFSLRRCSSLGPRNATAEGFVSRCSSTVRFSLLVDGFSLLGPRYADTARSVGLCYAESKD